MKDFEPDFFSRNNAGSLKSNLAFNTKIEEIVKTNFPFLADILYVEQMPGLNLNSKNVKVTSINGVYTLKSWGLLSPERIKQICELLLHINSKGIVVPTPILTLHSGFAVKRDKEYFTMFHFIAGENFNPKFSDLSTYLESINNLFLTLESFPGENYSTLTPDPELISRSLINSVSKNSSELYSCFPDEFARLQSITEKLLNDIEIFSKIDNVSKKQFSHFDLHPKNVLELPNNTYAFLDFESCLYSDPNIAWGFSLIKILRQMIVFSNGNLDPSMVGAYALNGINRQEFATRLQVENLPIFGRVEIMRRLVLIIDQFENFNSKTWLSMLPVQIQILRESYLLFPSE